MTMLITTELDVGERPDTAERGRVWLRAAAVPAVQHVVDRNARRWTRWAICAVYVWFGAVKLTGLSGATPLAKALTERTIGLHWFGVAFTTLALMECAIGVLFLFRSMAKVAVVALLAHMALVCSPLLLVPDMAWQRFLVPTLEGQYILKNLIVIAAALCIVRRDCPGTSLGER